MHSKTFYLPAFEEQNSLVLLEGKWIERFFKFNLLLTTDCACLTLKFHPQQVKFPFSPAKNQKSEWGKNFTRQIAEHSEPVLRSAAFSFLLISPEYGKKRGKVSPFSIIKLLPQAFCLFIPRVFLFLVRHTSDLSTSFHFFPELNSAKSC